MLTFLLAILAAAAAGYFSFTAGEGGHWGWSILACLAAVLAVLIPVNLIIRKKITAIFSKIQSDIVAAQQRLTLKAKTLAARGQGTVKLQQQMEQELADAVRQAIKPVEGVRKYKLWNPLANAQADLLAGQLYYQIRDYDSARPLLQRAMVVDPMILSMKMILLWKDSPEETKKLDNLFLKNIRRFKYEKGTLPYATYSWILVKQNRLTEAVTLLDEAKKKTDDPVIHQNWSHLANNRVRNFSNAGLGEQWYALGVEQPPAVRPTAQDRFGGRIRGGFRR